MIVCVIYIGCDSEKGNGRPKRLSSVEVTHISDWWV